MPDAVLLRQGHRWLLPQDSGDLQHGAPSCEPGTYLVVGLHVQQQGRNHADSLLAGDAARSVLALDELVQVGQHGQLAQLHPAEGEVPGQALGVPRQGLGRLQGLPIYLDPGAVSSANAHDFKVMAMCCW